MREIIKKEKQTIVPITSGTNPTCKISQSHGTKCTHTYAHRVYTIVLGARCLLIRYEYNKVHYSCWQYLLMVDAYCKVHYLCWVNG